MSRPLILLGGGGHALVVADAANCSGHVIMGFFDDDPGAALKRRMKLDHLGRLDEFDAAGRLEARLILAFGNLTLRARLLAAHNPPSEQSAAVVSKGAFVSPTATVDPGAFVGPGAVVHAFARVGAHAIINTGAIVEHECEIGENTHIAPGAVLGGDVRVGRDTLIGLGARVLPGVRIGSGCTIAAGAVVIRGVDDGEKVVGMPAKRR